MIVLNILWTKCVQGAAGILPAEPDDARLNDLPARRQQERNVSP